MNNLKEYIFEKLKIDKDTVSQDTVEINMAFIEYLKKYLLDEYKIEFKYFDERIEMSGNGKYIYITLPKSKRIYYRSIMTYINNQEEFKLAKKCATNNQYIYIYPKYE